MKGIEPQRDGETCVGLKAGDGLVPAAAVAAPAAIGDDGGGVPSEFSVTIPRSVWGFGGEVWQGFRRRVQSALG